MVLQQCISVLVVSVLCQYGFVQSIAEEYSGKAEYSIFGMMLRGHIFKKIMGAPLGSVCLHECYRDVKCQSFNYVISQYLCELSNRTKEAKPQDFVPDSDRYYFRRDWNRGKLKQRELKLFGLSHVNCDSWGLRGLLLHDFIVDIATFFLLTCLNASDTNSNFGGYIVFPRFPCGVLHSLLK